MAATSISILLDNPQQRFTNLDYLNGRVVIHLVADTAISAVTVKLEAESLTRLSGPKLAHNNEIVEKTKTAVELHRLLYKVETLFPRPGFHSQQNNPKFLLQAGRHEYQFAFRFPFNNDCQNNTAVRHLTPGGIGIAVGPASTNVDHMRRTLPPSLSGFPGQAEIKYYVKATVARPKFYQENLRSQLAVSFLPIEPPRPPDRQEETFARRQQHLSEFSDPAPKKGLFSLKSSNPDIKHEPSALQVDARLPNPAIITCNQPLPLRIVVQKLADTPTIIFLRTLQIELIGYTHVRADQLKRTEGSHWLMMSKANMELPLGDQSGSKSSEWTVPTRFWDDIRLPDTVVPTFETCNISRYYELEVRVGLAGAKKAEPTIFSLRLSVKVFSGNAPSPALIERMASYKTHATAPDGVTLTSDAKTGNPLSQPPTPLTPSYAQRPPQPPPGSYSANNSPGYPRPPQTSNDDDDYDLPPSYEDAMGDDIGPANGPPRPQAPPPLPARPSTHAPDPSRDIQPPPPPPPPPVVRRRPVGSSTVQDGPSSAPTISETQPDRSASLDREDVTPRPNLPMSSAEESGAGVEKRVNQ